MNDEQIQQIDLMANAVFGATSTQDERLRAEAMLKDITTFDNLPALRCVFERSANQYSQFLVAKSMCTIVTDNWNAFTANKEAPTEMRNWLVQIISAKGATMEKAVLPQLIRTLCRLEKLGWIENPSFQELPKEVHEFFITRPTTPQQPVVGLMILNQLVDEISLAIPRMPHTQHRKTVLSFRDNCLLDIFNVALSVLGTAVTGNPRTPEVNQAVTLALGCLNYDFAGGVFHDESSDDQGAIQIPSSWKPLLSDPATMELFWKLYAVLPAPQSADILKCTTQLASCRRSFFADDEDRRKWLSSILGGVLGILQKKIGLDNPDNYHEFCRLLGKIKPNYQLTELVGSQYYDEWIRLTAQFTIDAFANWQHTWSCSYYLLTLWSKLVAAHSLLRPVPKSSGLDELGPNIVLSYISSRMELARITVEGNTDIENALEDPDCLLIQLEALRVLARSMYSKVGPYLMQTAMADYNQTKELVQQIMSGAIPPASQQQVLMTLQIHDARLSWLVYMMGCVVTHHYSVGSSQPEAQAQAEGLDGELTALVLELSNVVKQRVENIPGQAELGTLQRLQSAIVYYVNGFRRTYIAEQTIPSTNVYPKLKEFTGIENNVGVCRVIVDMVLFILKGWRRCSRLVDEALNLFLQLSGGCLSGRLVLKLDSVKMLLTQQAHPSFCFSDTKEHLKQRTKFYRTLANLLFRELGTEPGDFDAFMKPLYDTGVQLSQLQPANFQQPDVKNAVIAWFRDLRGICGACAQKRTYHLFFDWLFPFLSNHGSPSQEPPLIQKILTLFHADEEVAIPLLRFHADLVNNITQRIMFEPSSPNGILLFRETSTLLKIYGQPRLAELGAQSPHPFMSPHRGDDPRADKRFKGVMICMNILGRALEGNYCNFGVFLLYQDKALDEALEVVIKLLLTIPHDDIFSYAKLGDAYTYLLETLFTNHLPYLMQLPTPQFLQLLKSLELGLESLEAKIVKRVTASYGHLCTFYFEHMQKARTNPESMRNAPSVQHVQHVRQHLSADPLMLNRALNTMFQLVLFDDNATHHYWAFSRAMLPIILVTDSLQEYSQRLMSRLADPTLRENLAAAFEKLMDGVGRNLEEKNRNKFTGNITLFKHLVKRCL